MKYWCSTTVKSRDTVALKDEHIRILRTAHSKSCCRAAPSHIARPRVSWLINTFSLCSSTQEYQWDLACLQAQKDLQHISIVMLYWNEIHMDFRACNLMCKLFICFFLQNQPKSTIFRVWDDTHEDLQWWQVLVIFSNLMLWLYNQLKINAVKRYISKDFFSSVLQLLTVKCPNVFIPILHNTILFPKITVYKKNTFLFVKKCIN